MSERAGGERTNEHSAPPVRGQASQGPPHERYGVTIPFDNVPLHEQRGWIEDAMAAGYTDLWSSEAGGTDGFTPLALASEWAPSARLGVAIVPAPYSPVSKYVREYQP